MTGKESRAINSLSHQKGKQAQSEEGTLDSHWHTGKVDAKDVTHRLHSPVPQEQGEGRRGRLGSHGEEGRRGGSGKPQSVSGDLICGRTE